MADYVQVITTTANQDDAERIARALVEARLAACVQVLGPMTSTYRWKGRIETAQEWQCVAKILAVPITAGSRAYLNWLDGELKAPKGPGPIEV
jgi:periplasmic divalent cation tolerance protein